MRLAAVDVGSNTVHALGADAVDGRVEEVGHFVEMPSLGAEVARSGRIGKEKGDQAVAALTTVIGQARELGFTKLVAGATEAVRAASDHEEFLARCSEAIGVPVHLIPAQREAQLSFAGVASRHASRRQWLMADLGGGSTELVVAIGHRIKTWRSLPIGSGVLAARYLSDPPRPGQREALRTEAVKLLDNAPDCDPTRFVVTGGTASNLPRVVSPRRPPTVLSRQALLRAADRLDATPAAELAARLTLRPGRVEAMRGGVEVLLLLLDWAGLDRLHVSIEGLRNGMLLAYLELGDDWYRDQPPD
jgi:exopolyphosphatase / guanosine-5'-triphosphate,3'-diphosphate pyrophosphatase